MAKLGRVSVRVSFFAIFVETASRRTWSREEAMRQTHLRIVAIGGVALLTAVVASMGTGEARAQTSITDTQILQGIYSLKNSAASEAVALGALQDDMDDVKTTIANLQSSLNSLQLAVNALQAAVNRVPLDPRKKYFLTDGLYDGAGVLTACPAGFHAASLWELLDTSNLKYDKSRASHSLLDDAGSGPPTGLGWVRTGGFSSGADLVGNGNCRAWTSANHDDFGTQALPNPHWDDSPSEESPAVNPWEALTRRCDSMQNVWCVEN